MFNKGLLTSNKDDYSTPVDFFQELDREFHFTLDACATPDNAKCEHFFTRANNGLEQIWEGTVFCNPPYGKGIAAWVEKGLKSSEEGATVVMLLPSRTDTKWWHEFCSLGEIRFIKGRLYFNGSRAPFPSVVVIFRYLGELIYEGYHHHECGRLCPKCGHIVRPDIEEGCSLCHIPVAKCLKIPIPSGTKTHGQRSA